MIEFGYDQDRLLSPKAAMLQNLNLATVFCVLTMVGTSPQVLQQTDPAGQVPPSVTTALDHFIKSADLIVLARTRAVHRVRQSEPLIPRGKWADNPIIILEMEVQERLMAPGDLTRIFVAMPSIRPEAAQFELEGQAALLFLREQRSLTGMA